MFALKGLDESSEEVTDEEDEEHDEPDEPEPPKKLKAKEARKKKGSKEKNAKGSSEELSEKEEDEEESWGLKKSAYYSSNAAQIESDDEEAREMEEQEARRLQMKLRALMREEDFGYSEALQNASMVDLKPVEYVLSSDIFLPHSYLRMITFAVISGDPRKQCQLSPSERTRSPSCGICRRLILRRWPWPSNGRILRSL